MIGQISRLWTIYSIEERPNEKVVLHCWNGLRGKAKRNTTFRLRADQAKILLQRGDRTIVEILKATTL